MYLTPGTFTFTFIDPADIARAAIAAR